MSYELKISLFEKREEEYVEVENPDPAIVRDLRGISDNYFQGVFGVWQNWEKWPKAEEDIKKLSRWHPDVFFECKFEGENPFPMRWTSIIKNTELIEYWEAKPFIHKGVRELLI